MKLSKLTMLAVLFGTQVHAEDVNLEKVNYKSNFSCVKKEEKGAYLKTFRVILQNGVVLGTEEAGTPVQGYYLEEGTGNMYPAKYLVKIEKTIDAPPVGYAAPGKKAVLSLTGKVYSGAAENKVIKEIVIGEGEYNDKKVLVFKGTYTQTFPGKANGTLSCTEFISDVNK